MSKVDTLDLIGKPITEDIKRDAVHIAVAPVTCGQILMPGEHVGWMDKDHTRVARVAPRIGIIDPFLAQPTRPDQRVFLFLYPATIQSLRHVWTHADFPDEGAVFQRSPVEVVAATDVEKTRAEQWIREWLGTSDCPFDYEDTLKMAIGEIVPSIDPDAYGPCAYKNDGEYILSIGRDAYGDIPSDFWENAEIVTGQRIPDYKRAIGFRCSC